MIIGYLLGPVMIFWFLPWAYHIFNLEIQGDLQYDAGSQKGIPKNNRYQNSSSTTKYDENACEDEDGKTSR